MITRSDVIVLLMAAMNVGLVVVFAVRERWRSSVITLAMRKCADEKITSAEKRTAAGDLIGAARDTGAAAAYLSVAELEEKDMGKTKT